MKTIHILIHVRQYLAVKKIKNANTNTFYNIV